MEDNGKIEKLKKQKKTSTMLIIGGVVACVVGMVVCGTVNIKALKILFGIMIGAGSVVAIIGGIIGGKAVDGLRQYCSKCNASLIGAAYSYREVRRSFDKNSNLTVVVEIDATCPDCGHSNKYTKAFTLNSSSNSLQYQVDSYCQKTYGH